MEGTVVSMKSLCTPIRITKEEKNMSSEQSSRTVTQLMKELFQHDMDVRSVQYGAPQSLGTRSDLTLSRAGIDTACDRYINKNMKNYITNRKDKIWKCQYFCISYNQS